jgi:hypothetical protein
MASGKTDKPKQQLTQLSLSLNPLPWIKNSSPLLSFDIKL